MYKIWLKSKTTWGQNLAYIQYISNYSNICGTWTCIFIKLFMEASCILVANKLAKRFKLFIDFCKIWYSSIESLNFEKCCLKLQRCADQSKYYIRPPSNLESLGELVLFFEKYWIRIVFIPTRFGLLCYV